jgi:hypothetical protein
MGGQQQASQTGTRDETYDVVSVLYHALQGAENCQRYCTDATQDDELRQFFEQALDQQRQLADRAKQLLGRRLQGGGRQGERGAFFEGEESEVPAAGSAA